MLTPTPTLKGAGSRIIGGEKGTKSLFAPPNLQFGGKFISAEY
jgi:hypothetical protein